jgi:anti-sigma-K factor RskA
MDRNTLLDLIPAYALGALDANERADVEALLAADVEAQQLLAEYQAVTEALVLATPARRAPAHMGDDLRRRLAAAPPASDQAAIKSLPTQRRAVLWTVLAAAAVVIVLAGLLLVLRNTKPQSPDPAQLYAEIAAQPDALHIPITPVFQPSTSGELVASADGKQAVVLVENLPAIAANQTFQLWLVDPAGAHSGGLLQFANAQGPNYIPLPLDKPISDYVGFGVSIEPQGGSPKSDGPTGPRAFGITLKT